MDKRGESGLSLLHAGLADDRPLAWSEAKALGLLRHEDARLRQMGRLSRPHRGVRALTRPVDLIDRARAASLVLPPGAAIGRRTAAELLDVDPRLPSERDQQLDVECLVPTGRTPVRHHGIRCFATDLPAAELADQDGFTMTTPDRTLADLLRWLPPHMGLAVADLMARRKLIDEVAVEAILDRWSGHRYVARARYLLAHIEPKAESYGESWLRLRLLDAGFPRPTAQVPIREDGREIYRLDLGWPELRIAVEYDGEEFHESREQRNHDAERREDLFRRHRWNVVGVGKAFVLGSSLALERGVGEMLGMLPRITQRAW